MTRMGSHFIGARRSDLFKVLDRSILGRNWGGKTCTATTILRSRELFELWEDRVEYASRVREQLTQLDQLMREDDRDFGENVDHAWEPDPGSKA